MAFWNEAIETMPRAELEKLQMNLLKKQVRAMYGQSKFFHDRMRDAGMHPDDVTDRDSFRKVPFMKKTDLRDNYPDKLFVRPYEELARIHVSSGTTGLPTVVGYTQHDLDEWSESLARGMASFGMSSRDLLQNYHGYGLFTGGLGVHQAAEKLGASVLPTSTGNTARQVQLMMDLPVTACAGTPSYLFHIADTFDGMGKDIRKDTKVRLAIAGGEPWSESMRNKIQERTGIKVHNCYGASEFYGPMFLECEKQRGAHVWADICYIEILDKDGELCADGERGEMVVTMLNKEAFPLIRYRIGDISALDWTKCECGRTHPRLMRLSGRTDDMLIVRGINVFPSQIESVIGEARFLSPFYHITLDNKNYMDNMVIEVELDESRLTEDTVELGNMARSIEARMKDVLNLKTTVKLMLPGTLKRFEGKAQHVTDNRNYD
ncbi:MAG: phenylacetate--CoA ligase [Candidatus Methanoplasma sp.]|jgi:phenylacetate-CoA ligase|nr:phenylacetate--CoA ligase [Candidatus Methanoplasma sp.]